MIICLKIAIKQDNKNYLSKMLTNVVVFGRIEVVK